MDRRIPRPCPHPTRLARVGYLRQGREDRWFKLRYHAIQAGGHARREQRSCESCGSEEYSCRSNRSADIRTSPETIWRRSSKSSRGSPTVIFGRLAVLPPSRSLVDPSSHGGREGSMDSSTTSPLTDVSRMPARPRTTCDRSSTEWGGFCSLIFGL